MFDLWYSRLREPGYIEEDNEKFIQIWLGFFRELVASISSVLDPVFMEWGTPV